MFIWGPFARKLEPAGVVIDGFVDPVGDRQKRIRAASRRRFKVPSLNFTEKQPLLRVGVPRATLILVEILVEDNRKH